MKNMQPWHQYPLINKQLEKVNSQIQDSIQTSYIELQNALKQMANNGGKYLRPSILILSAQIVSRKKEVSKQIIQLAASIEILHMATLIHDDVIDDSDERRGNISIQAKFGKDIAVYAGDLLFTSFFDLMLASTDEHDYLVENAQTMRAVLSGELGQMDERFNLDQNFDNYLENIKGKTAALFRLAAKEGAHFGGGSNEEVTALAGFAENIGVAFQIIDDILDYSGSQKMNKPILEDLTTGVYSLPLLLCLNKTDYRKELIPLLNKRYQMTKADLEQVQTIVLKSNAITDSRELAKKYTDKALDSLTIFADSAAKKILEKLTKNLINRAF